MDIFQGPFGWCGRSGGATMAPPMPAAASASLDDVLKTQGLTGSEDPQVLCASWAARRHENFPVLSLAVPKAKRPAFAAIYAFCRAVDDLGDEAPGDRLALLDAWEEDLLKVWTPGGPRHPIHRALVPVVRGLAIPDEPFRRLVRANRMDQVKVRYATFEELREYCLHSADPVGRLVLHVFGYSDPERQRLSDATCTALQLANFWQDITRDLKDRGRSYLPLEDLMRFGVSEADLASRPAPEAFRRLMAYEVSRARGLFTEGLALLDGLEGRPRWTIAAFSAGGLAVLDAIAGQGYDVLGRRPALSGARKAGLLLSVGARLALGADPCPSARRADSAA